MNQTLIEALNKLLASSFTLYLKAHQFHWNVEGQDFPQYHEFFGDFYEEIYGSVDTTAEEIRALGSFAQGSLTQYKEISTVRDQLTVPTLQEMVAILNRDNQSIISILNEVHEIASTNKEYGLLNYVEDRLDKHKKHGWMLRASLVKQGVAEEVTVSDAPVEQVEEDIDEEVKVYVLNTQN